MPGSPLVRGIRASGLIAADIRDARPSDVGDRRVRITHASTRSADVDRGGMPSRGLLGGGLMGTAAHPVSHGDGPGDGGVARLGLSGALLSPPCHADQGPETGASW